MKVNIRFLMQGNVTKETPANFKTMNAEEKMDWARGDLNDLSDAEIFKAMSHYDKPGLNGNGYFDESPDPSAIESAMKNNYGQLIVSMEEWDLFASGFGRTIYDVKEEEEKRVKFILSTGRIVNKPLKKLTLFEHIEYNAKQKLNQHLANEAMLKKQLKS